MLGAGFIKFHQLFQKLLVMGEGEGGGGGALQLRLLSLYIYHIMMQYTNWINSIPSQQ